MRANLRAVGIPGNAPAPATRGLRPAAALAVLTALAALLRFPTLDVQSFWFDETVTVVDDLRPSLAATLAQLPSQELAPPLYFVLAWAWTRPFGIGEVGIRSLSALLGTLTVPVVYSAGAQLVSRRAGLAAAALAAVSPLFVYYSQEARPYALVILLGGLSFWLWARLVERGGETQRRGRELAAWALVCALALATHYFAVFLVAPQALWLLVLARTRRELVAAALAVVAVGAAGLALLSLALTQLGSGGVDWIARTPLPLRVLEVAQSFPTGWQSARSPTWPLAFALVAVGLALLLVRGDRRERRGAGIALAVAGGTLAIPIALALAGFDLFTLRHLIVVAVPLTVGVAAGFVVRRAGWVGVAALSGLCLMSLALNVAISSTPRLQRDDWRSASAALGRPLVPRVLAFTSFTREPVQAYGHTVIDAIPPGERVGEIVLMGNTVAGAPVPAPPAPGFALAERREVQKLTLIRYRSPRPRPVSEEALVTRLGLSPHAVVLERP